ncbi:acid protease [Cryphonectria parasitica EP155]|uniref:Acid protease n=1 Tax=Cryphonectria parasitica (strain ATCC 38755 / EP155) TaxID=660469 RepID=A0A9P4Y1P0_CRYP1|nr:acid protease [Cryphonectria parasitica EP155]KAF3765028.1 acid protease [Cryphonectria parasitica EP155]
MRPGDTAALLALASTAVADVVTIPVARSPAKSVQKRNPRLSKRATLTESLVNNITEGGYYATVSVGTPGQTLTMVLDTGSSDAFVISADADLCTEKKLQVVDQETCGATYNASESSTYKDLIPGGFEIEYADGTTAAGDYITDDFLIGGKTVKNLQMGLADKTAVGTGVLGIGFELNEAAQAVYSNLVVSMVNQSVVSTMAYSLYLNDYYSSTGNILFGGVDTEKFIGDLVVVPILPDAESKNYSSFTVGLTGLSFASSNGTTYNQSLSDDDGSLDSILDSGTTLSYLPDDIATSLFSAVGAYEYTELGSSLALVDCSLDVEFTFRINSTASIVVPRDELVLDVISGDEVPTSIPFANPCLFGIQNIGDESDESGGGGGGGPEGTGSAARQAEYAILGDSFLRSAYVVYDLDNLQIGLAQANLNSTSTNVQALSAGESSMPAFSGVASQSASSSSSSGTSTSTTGTSTTGTSSGTTSTKKSAAMGRSPPTYEGLMSVVGITLAFAMSGGLLFWL